MLAIVDSGGANLASVGFALERLGQAFVVTDDAAIIRSASHVLLPGVGAARPAMERLRQKNLADCIRELRQPVLGICLGMQLLFTRSEEGGVDMLGIVSAPVVRFGEKDGMTVPHMGWNTVSLTKAHLLFKGIPDDSFFYFVHSYCTPAGAFTIGQTVYGQPFSAIINKDNFFGCQFHPERSGKYGEQLLSNFLRL